MTSTLSIPASTKLESLRSPASTNSCTFCPAYEVRSVLNSVHCPARSTESPRSSRTTSVWFSPTTETRKKSSLEELCRWANEYSNDRVDSTLAGTASNSETTDVTPPSTSLTPTVPSSWPPVTKALLPWAASSCNSTPFQAVPTGVVASQTPVVAVSVPLGLIVQPSVSEDSKSS